MASTAVTKFGFSAFRQCSNQLSKFYAKRIPLSTASVSVVENGKVEQGPANPLDHPDYFNVNQLVNMKELFDARVHLGHHEGAWNPLTAPYIHGLRATQHVINLDKTVECLKCALNVSSHIAYKKGVILFISTNPKFDYLIQKTARNAGEYFITLGWRKGLFTASNKMLGTDKLPDMIVALNLSRFERVREAIMEAAMCNIPVIGIVDTDCDPRLITYPVPGNDDSLDSVKLFLKLFQQAILNAKERYVIDSNNNRTEENEEAIDIEATPASSS